jgi:hypothetical protein
MSKQQHARFHSSAESEQTTRNLYELGLLTRRGAESTRPITPPKSRPVNCENAQSFAVGSSAARNLCLAQKPRIADLGNRLRSLPALSARIF